MKFNIYVISDSYNNNSMTSLRDSILFCLV